ncbi:MAG TPA: ABC transporter ATP-binding protein [Acidimicrobiales bacterium]|nr:ABC transporter ATP-binding protein [Acidimicrobiales bacterium]
MDETLIEAENIDFCYGRLQVLFQVSLRVARSEALALLGTNGAGKSTLLRVLAGLARPSTGSVTLDGQDVTGLPAEQIVKRGIVLVCGGKAVFADLTVEENLLVQAHTIGGRAAVREAQARVYDTFPRIHERLRQKAGSLSGGEQQQLALAKALMLDPQVLCIDELSLGLAPVVVQELLAVVRRIHGQGVTIVLVEQSLNIAAELCSRAIFMEKGAIRFEGSPTDLLERDDIARAVFLGANAE